LRGVEGVCACAMFEQKAHRPDIGEHGGFVERCFALIVRGVNVSA